MNVFITGVSSGIGHALAAEYLRRGAKVYGVSRRRPDDLCEHEAFEFRSVDLNDHGATRGVLGELLGGLDRLDVVVLNAGVLSQAGDMRETDLAHLKDVTDINLWANKTVLDVVLQDRAVEQVIAISSGASVNGNRGWNAYSISKAALNMLVKLYAAECPETYFCAFAPGLVDTAMQEEISGREPDPRFPAFESLREKRGTEAMPSAEETAARFVDTFASLPGLVASGEYVDIREMET